jgi:hypothetical protein
MFYATFMMTGTNFERNDLLLLAGGEQIRRSVSKLPHKI